MLLFLCCCYLGVFLRRRIDENTREGDAMAFINNQSTTWHFEKYKERLQQAERGGRQAVKQAGEAARKLPMLNLCYYLLK
jgi:hypothetical protein